MNQKNKKWQESVLKDLSESSVILDRLRKHTSWECKIYYLQGGIDYIDDLQKIMEGMDNEFTEKLENDRWLLEAEIMVLETNKQLTPLKNELDNEDK